MFLFNQLLLISRKNKQLFVIIIDIFLSLIASFTFLFLRFENIFIPNINQLFIIFLTTLIYLPLFLSFGLYNSIFRYSGINSLKLILKACFIYGFVLFIVVFLIQIQNFPRSFGIIQPIFFFILTFNSRVLFVFIYKKISRPVSRKNILIYGCGNTGQFYLENLIEYNVIGFIDDDLKKISKKINEYNIYGFHEIEKIILKYKIKVILIAIPKINYSPKIKNLFIQKIDIFNVPIKFLPAVNDYSKVGFDISSINHIDAEDLINRKTNLDINISKYLIYDKIVVITGAGGSIGSELSKKIISLEPSKLILLDISEFNLYKIITFFSNDSFNQIKTKIIPILCNINNQNRITEIFNEYRPEIVYHAAAYKHVNILENNINESLENNVFGTLNLLSQSILCEVKNFILISTDKAVRSTNIMGSSKRLAELVLQAYASDKNFFNQTIISMVRFGNVLGSTGSVLPLFNEQIKKGGPLTVTDKNVTRYFMSISEASELVVISTSLAFGGDVFVLDMGKPFKIYDLAKKIIRLNGFSLINDINPDGDIKIKIIGLKPGEKLHEELLIGNNPVTTKVKNIIKANEKFLNYEELNKILETLKEKMYKNDYKAIKEIFKYTNKI